MNRGIDFDDPEYGFKEEEKSPLKVRMLRCMSNCFLTMLD